MTTVLLALTLAHQTVPEYGGLPATSMWSQTTNSRSQFAIDRDQTKWDIVLTSGFMQADTDGTLGANQGSLQIMYNKSWHTMIENIQDFNSLLKLRDGTYRVAYNQQASGNQPNITYTLTGYYSPRSGSLPVLRSDRLWQHFSAMDGATFNISGNEPQRMLTGLYGRLQRQNGNSWADAYRQPSNGNIRLPGVLLTPGTYRVVDTKNGASEGMAFGYTLQ